jgi:hypothetical protein
MGIGSSPETTPVEKHIGLRMLAWGVPGAYCSCLRHDVSSVVFFAYPGQSTTGKRGYFGKLGSRSCKRQRRNTEPRAEPTCLQCRQPSQRPASEVTIHTRLLANRAVRLGWIRMGTSAAVRSRIDADLEEGWALARKQVEAKDCGVSGQGVTFDTGMLVAIERRKQSAWHVSRPKNGPLSQPEVCEGHSAFFSDDRMASSMSGEP